MAPQRLDEALSVLRQHGAEAKILAGGQSLVPLLNLRLTTPKILVDLNGVAGLDGIQETAAGLCIGAMTRQSTVERSPIVRKRCPILPQAIRHVGHTAIRHRGTIGGSLVHADPAAELPAVALALDATFEVLRPGSARTVRAEDFFVDSLITAIDPDEIVREIVFPVPKPSTGYAVEEIARRHGDFAIAGVIAVMELDNGGHIADLRIALFGVAFTPVRARSVEQALIGHKPAEESIRQSAALLDALLEPPGDIRASSAYRKHAAIALTARAVTKAVQLCREQPI